MSNCDCSDCQNLWIYWDEEKKCFFLSCWNDEFKDIHDYRAYLTGWENSYPLNCEISKHVTENFRIECPYPTEQKKKVDLEILDEMCKGRWKADLSKIGEIRIIEGGEIIKTYKINRKDNHEAPKQQD